MREEMQLEVVCKDISHFYDDDDGIIRVTFRSYENKNYVVLVVNNTKLVIDKETLKEVVNKL